MRYIFAIAFLGLVACTSHQFTNNAQTTYSEMKANMDSSVRFNANIKEISRYQLALTTDGKRGNLYVQFTRGGDTLFQGLSSADIAALGVVLKEKFIAWNPDRKEIFGISQAQSSPVASTHK